MNISIKIPISFVLEMDDVGWDNGRDLRLSGKASRSGLPRYHAKEDYEAINLISESVGKKLSAALCLGDWDKDNLLKGQVGITHNPFGWDRRSEIDIQKFISYRDALEKGNIDYMVHGLLHGRYTKDGKRINEHEYFDYEILSDGTKKEYFDEADFRRRLDLFFEIYNSWGFKQKIRGFVVPCGTPTDEDIQNKMCKILREYGIVYWSDSFGFSQTLKVVNGVAMFKWGRNGGSIPWDAYDYDPSELGNLYDESGEGNSCLKGSHWTNYIRFNPKNNYKNVELWTKFYQRQSEVFGLALANDLAEAVNQLFYHEFATVTVNGNSVEFNLLEVENQKLECHKNEFLVSFKKGIEPKSCKGAEITLFETHNEFNTYKITHNDTFVTVEF